MDEKIEQIGNTIVIRNKDNSDILETIGAHNFSFDFNNDTVQLVDSSRIEEIRTVNLNNFYDVNDVALNTRVKVVDYLSNFKI